MKIREDADLVALLKKVQICHGDVFLNTSDGDHLNLKSVLTQYVFVLLGEKREMLKESYIECSREDAMILDEYLVTA